MKKLFCIILTAVMLVSVLFSVSISAAEKPVEKSTEYLTYSVYLEGGYATLTSCRTEASGRIRVPYTVEYEEALYPVKIIGKTRLRHVKILPSSRWRKTWRR